MRDVLRKPCLGNSAAHREPYAQRLSCLDGEDGVSVRQGRSGQRREPFGAPTEPRRWSPNPTRSAWRSNADGWPWNFPPGAGRTITPGAKLIRTSMRMSRNPNRSKSCSSIQTTPRSLRIKENERTGKNVQHARMALLGLSVCLRSPGRIQRHERCGAAAIGSCHEADCRRLWRLATDGFFHGLCLRRIGLVIAPDAGDGGLNFLLEAVD